MQDFSSKALIITITIKSLLSITIEKVLLIWKSHHLDSTSLSLSRTLRCHFCKSGESSLLVSSKNVLPHNIIGDSINALVKQSKLSKTLSCKALTPPTVDHYSCLKIFFSPLYHCAICLSSLCPLTLTPPTTDHYSCLKHSPLAPLCTKQARYT